MPWPPHPPRKHPDLSPEEARSKALAPYRFEPGHSGNPEGLPQSRREQMEVCERAALPTVPEAIVTLSELMRHSLDDRVRTRCAEILLERGLGKAREAPPPEETPNKRLNVQIHFVKPSHTKGLEEPRGPIIDEAPEPPVSDSAQPVGASLEIADLEEHAERLMAELAELKRAVGPAADYEFPAAPQPFARPSPPPLGRPRPTGGLYTNAQGLSGRRR